MRPESGGADSVAELNVASYVIHASGCFLRHQTTHTGCFLRHQTYIDCCCLSRQNNCIKHTACKKCIYSSKTSKVITKHAYYASLYIILPLPWKLQSSTLRSQIFSSSTKVIRKILIIMLQNKYH